MRYGRDYGRDRVWMGGGGIREGDSDVEYGYSARGYRGGGAYGGRSYREPGGSPGRRGGEAVFWGEPDRMRGPRGRYPADYRHEAAPPAGYGYGFRRGYEMQGGFGPANERASRRDFQAWSGPLRVGRRYGQGYGRG